MNTIELVYPGRAELAEGPNWHDGALWWVDVVVGTLNRLDPNTGRNEARPTGNFLSCAAPTSDGRWLIARKDHCALLDWSTGKIETFAQPNPALPPEQRFNDGKCDPTGRFWVGTMDLKIKPGAAGVYVLEPSGQFTRVLTGLSLANGLAWSSHGDAFYHIDTPTRRIKRYRFTAATGKIDAGEVLIEFSAADGKPDGMTIDVEDNLWVALWDGHAVAHVDGRTGKILEKISLPVAQVSCPIFGGADLHTLFITTAWENYSLEQRMASPLAGSIFAVRLPVPGRPVTPFALSK